jgi:uncharacterized peroxidase-related enzyme
MLWGATTDHPSAPTKETAMSRIPAVDPASATGPVKPLLDGVHRGLGATPNLFRVAAQSASALEGMVMLFGAVAKGQLDAKTREAVALAVSEANGCDYCLSAHTALGRQAGLSDEALAGAREGRGDDPRGTAVLRLARTIVERRGHLGDAELVEARRAGLTDGEIIEVVVNVALTTLTNYLNVVAATEIDFPIVRHRAR